MIQRFDPRHRRKTFPNFLQDGPNFVLFRQNLDKDDGHIETLTSPLLLSGTNKKAEKYKHFNTSNTLMTQDSNDVAASFDTNEVPSNAINTNCNDKSSRIAGLVLSRRTGFVVAHQKGTLRDIEIT